MSSTRVTSFALAVLLGCHAPPRAPAVVVASPPAPVPSREEPVPTPAPPRPIDLAELAAKVGAELIAGRVAEARALIGDRAGDCMGAVGTTERRDGGAIVHGGRVTARLDRKGALESYQLEPGCVDFADEQLTITQVVSDDQATYALRGALEDSASFPVGAATVEISPEWVAVLSPHDGYLAWPRGAAKAMHGEAPEDEGPTPRIAGRYLVTATDASITLHRPDGTDVAVRGCKGRLMAATAVAGGVALQVSNGVDSTLCVVSDKGVTRQATALGHATCGLRERQPCAWELAAASPQALVFSGLRGGVVVIDPTSGAKVSYRGEPDAQFPPEYATCGDSICVTTIANADRTDFGRMQRVGRVMQYRRIAAKAAEATPAWCTEADLLLPCASL